MHAVQASARRLLAVGAVLTTLVAFPRTTDVFGLPKLLVLVLCGSAVLVIVRPFTWPLLESRRRTFVVAGVFVSALTAAALLTRQSAFVTMYGAMDRANGWLCYVGLTVVFLAAAVAFTPATVVRLLGILGTLGVVEALYGFVQYLGRDPITWQRPFIVMGTFGNPDFVSGFLGIAAVGLLGLTVRSRVPLAPRIAAGFGLLLVLTVIRLSLAIQGLLAFAVGTVVMGGLLLLGVDRSNRIRMLRWPYLLLALALLALTALAMTDRGPLARLLFKASVQDRLYMWDAAWRMFRLQPLYGVGIDAYGDWYRFVRSEASVAFHGPVVFSNEAHSVFLNLLATGGLLVAVPYLLLWALIAREAFRAARDPATRTVAAVLAGAWAAYLADSLVSMDQIGFAVWGWLLAGAIIALRPTATLGAVRQASRWSLASVLMLVLAMAGLGSVAYAVQVDRAVGQASLLPTATLSERAVAVPALVQAAHACPEPIRVLGVVEQLRSLGANAAAARTALDAVHRFPRESLLWQELAQVYEVTHQWAKAVAVREHMATLDPLNSESLHQLALDRVAMG